MSPYTDIPSWVGLGLGVGKVLLVSATTVTSVLSKPVALGVGPPYTYPTTWVVTLLVTDRILQAVSVAQKLPGSSKTGGYHADGSFQKAVQSAMQVGCLTE